MNSGCNYINQTTKIKVNCPMEEIEFSDKSKMEK